MNGKVTISLDDFDELRAQANYYKRLSRAVEKSGLDNDKVDKLDISVGIKVLFKELISDIYLI